MMKLKKWVLKLILFALLLGIVNTLFPGTFSIFSSSEQVNALGDETDHPILLDAIENIRIYSTFNNQTLNETKLNQLSTDFYLPLTYGDVTLTWQVDSSRIILADVATLITVSSISGDTEIEVVEAHIVSLPSAFQGNEPFVLTATLFFGEESASAVYTGQLVPIMPDGFWEGAFFTFFRYFSLFVEGVTTTLLLSLVGTVIGFALAMVLVMLRLLKSNQGDNRFIKGFKTALSTFAKVYVTVFRGTPMIVQAAFFWYGLGLFGDALLCGLFVVSINTTAYIAEILRGGIQSVDSGQMEAARSLGMSGLQTMRYVIFPQAIKNSMPAIGNEFVINIKDTSVLSIIGIFELFNQTRKIAGMHYRQLEAYFVVALIYLFLTYTVTKVLQGIEKKLDMPIQELKSSN